jgi:hypothetical protein
VRILAICMTAALAACARPPTLADACVASEVTLAVTTPQSYACHDPYKATLMVTNGSCETITIDSITVSAVVTSGPCGPPAPGTYTPMVTTIAPHTTATVLDLTSGPFCCGAPGCAAQMSCDETFTYQVPTSAAGLMATADAHLDLGGCDTVCQ